MWQRARTTVVPPRLLYPCCISVFQFGWISHGRWLMTARCWRGLSCLCCTSFDGFYAPSIFGSHASGELLPSM